MEGRHEGEHVGHLLGAFSLLDIPSPNSSRILIALSSSVSGSTHFKATFESRTYFIPHPGFRGSAGRPDSHTRRALAFLRASGPSVPQPDAWHRDRGPPREHGRWPLVPLGRP